MMAYPNTPHIIGALVSSKMASLHELQTVYGAEDAYDMFEIIGVDAYNQQLLTKKD